MSRVHGNQQIINAYLDGELGDVERESLLAHCKACGACRELLENRRALFGAIRSTRPRIKAPPGLRDKVAALLEAGHNTQNTRSSPDSRRAASSRGWPFAIRPFFGYAILLSALVSVGAFWFLARREARAAQFVQMATELHHRELRGLLPVQFPSSSARAVTAWFSSRLPFALRLPTYQDDSGDRSRYEMIGGSLASFEGKAAAYIAYRMQNEQISLLVVSADQAVATGGETIRAKSIMFHSAQTDDLQVITWSVHHLTYALVSHVKLPRHQSCVVCHADPKGQALLQSALTHPPGFCDRGPAILPLRSGRFSSAALPNGEAGTKEFLDDLQ